MNKNTSYDQHFQQLQENYLNSLDDSCAFFEESLSFMQTGCLDQAAFMAVKLEATNLVGSGKSYGYTCISDAADLLLSMLKHLKEQFGDNIALPIEEQEHLAVLTLAMLVIIRKVRAGEILPEKLQVQSLFFNPVPDQPASNSHSESDASPGEQSTPDVKLKPGIWARLRGDSGKG